MVHVAFAEAAAGLNTVGGREVVGEAALQLHVDEEGVEPKVKDFFTAREFDFGIVAPKLFAEFLPRAEFELDILG